MTRSPLIRLSLVVLTFSTLAGVALIARQAQPTSATMTDAATKFLATLTPEQKSKATFGFDDEHRQKWYFTPQQDKQKQSTRKGLRMDGMTDEQKTATLALLKTGLSTKGFDQATTIMSMEAILNELEKNGAMTRNPAWYFVSVFGDPTNTGKWGWRIEGHHLSVNFTLEKGVIVSATPLLFATNPAEVRDGSRKGLRTLAEIEDTAKQLIQSFDDDQNKLAKQAKQFPEIKEGQPNAAVGEPVGIPASKLTDDQKAMLMKVLEAYANRSPADLAKLELQRVKDAGADKVQFAYCVEPDKKGKPYSYRVHGPTFVVEFLNVQGDSAGNPANHIHSGWRRLPMDFALQAK